jgi:hypothetical protein
MRPRLRPGRRRARPQGPRPRPRQHAVRRCPRQRRPADGDSARSTRETARLAPPKRAAHAPFPYIRHHHTALTPREEICPPTRPPPLPRPASSAVVTT